MEGLGTTKNKGMKTDNRNSEKDLNANPESRLNTNKPVSKPDRFPESNEARGEIRKDEPTEKKKVFVDDEVLMNLLERLADAEELAGCQLMQVEVVLSRDPIQLLRVTDVKAVVVEPSPVVPAQTLDDLVTALLAE